MAQPGYAQDTGDPVMQTITIYTLGGTAVGAGLGFVYYMLDPLNPNADFKQNFLTGAAIGTFAGFIAGIMILHQQATVPNSSPYPEEEFEQEVDESLIGQSFGNSPDFYQSGKTMILSENIGFRQNRESVIPLVGVIIYF